MELNRHEKNQLSAIKEMYATKAFLACLLCEHLEEFKGMYVEDVKKCIGDVLISSKNVYESEDDTYDIYFTAQSPLLHFEHEIVVCVEIRLRQEELPNRLPFEVEHTLGMHLQKKFEDTSKTIYSYSFWFYMDPPVEDQHKNFRFKASINGFGNDLFKDEKSETIIINLGDPIPSGKA